MAEVSINIMCPQPIPCKFGDGCNRKNLDCQFFHGATTIPRTKNNNNPHINNSKPVQTKPYQNRTVRRENAPSNFSNKPKQNGTVRRDNVPSDFSKKPYQNGTVRRENAPSNFSKKPYQNGTVRRESAPSDLSKKPYQNGTVRRESVPLDLSKKPYQNGTVRGESVPLDPAVLRMMKEEAKRLKKQNDSLREGIKKKDEIHARQMANLRAKNKDLSDRRPVSSLRVEAQIRIQNTYISPTYQNFSLNTRDPVDLFVFDQDLKAHVHVLEYHKPADFVDLRGKTLSL